MNQIRIYSQFSRLLIPIFKAQEGKRLDRYLAQHLNQPWEMIQKMLRNGEVMIDDQKIKIGSIKLSEGQTIEVWDGFKKEIEQRGSANNAAYEKFKEMILYENQDLLILNKHHGYSSQGGANIHKNIPDLLKLYLQEFYIIHRLDQSAAGILVIPKKKEIAQLISRQFEDKIDIVKEYSVIVQGWPTKPNGTIDIPLEFNDNKQKQIPSVNGKISQTDYSTIQTFNVGKEIWTQLKVRIHQGRKHQIRAHLKYVLNTPVIFDQKYGFEFTTQNRKIQEQLFSDQQGILLQHINLTLKGIDIKENQTNPNGQISKTAAGIKVSAEYSEQFKRFFEICI